jgi:DNA primase
MELTHLCGQNDHVLYDIAQARELLEAVQNDIEIREWQDPQFGFTSLNVIPEWWLDTFVPAISHPRALKYLEKRGISVGVSNLLSLRYDKQRDVVGFPARDFDGNLVGMRGRKIELEGDEPNDWPRFHEYKYQNLSNSGEVWLGEHLVDLARPVVIVEGNFDYARVFGVYSNVLAAQTASIAVRKAQRLMGAWSLVLFLDNDMAGKHGANRLRSVLGAECVIQEVTYPEGYKDPGSLPESEISGMLSPFI